MPVETHQIHLKPADFFSKNPAIDVPSAKNQTSILYKKGGLVSSFVTEVPQSHDGDRRKSILIVDDNSTDSIAVQKTQQQGIKACCM